MQEDEDYSLLTFRNVSIRHVGNWTCRAWNDVQSVNRTSCLIVNVAPSWLKEPKNSYQVVMGNSIIIDCYAQGNPKPRLLWKKSIATPSGSSTINGPEEYSINEPIDSLSAKIQVYSNGTLWIQEVDKSDAGFYMCEVS